MKIPGSLFCAIAVACCAACFQGSVAAASLGSAFNYQGRLLESGAPATGRYDFQFATAGNRNGRWPAVTISSSRFSTPKLEAAR